MIKRNMYVLAVQSLGDAANYYESVLGFTVHEVGDGGWRIFERDNCQIMAGHCPESTPARELGDHSYFAYLVIDSADRYYEELVERGAEITKPLHCNLPVDYAVLTGRSRPTAEVEGELK